VNKEEQLKAKILEAQQNGDLASLYVLQDEALEILNEDDVSGFFANILDLALENLTNTLEACEKLKIGEVQDFATLRALYEYAMEHYHAGAISDASALFEVLSGVSDDEEFSKALVYHLKATEQNVSLDTFLDDYADIDKTQENGTFYISVFTKKAQKLLENSKSVAE
jgi:hypothetical protein